MGNPELVNIFSAEGAYLGQLTRAGTKKFVRPKGVAVDAAGAVYVSQNGNEISKYVPSANPPLNTDNVANFKIEGYGGIDSWQPAMASRRARSSAAHQYHLPPSR